MSDPTFTNLIAEEEGRWQGVAHQNDTPFDVAYQSEIADNLWQGGCETGLALPHHFKHVVSLYPWEQYKLRRRLMTNLAVHMHDTDEVPVDRALVLGLAQWVNVCRKTAPVLVHCQVGLNRSSLIVGTALVLNGDVASGEEAIDLIRSKRSPACLCNDVFADFVRSVKP